jgi:hypothetical protein
MPPATMAVNSVGCSIQPPPEDRWSKAGHRTLGAAGTFPTVTAEATAQRHPTLSVGRKTRFFEVSMRSATAHDCFLQEPARTVAAPGRESNRTDRVLRRPTVPCVTGIALAPIDSITALFSTGAFRRTVDRDEAAIA